MALQRIKSTSCETTRYIYIYIYYDIHLATYDDTYMALQRIKSITLGSSVRVASTQ